MKSITAIVVLALCQSLAQAAPAAKSAPAEEAFSVIIGGNPVGHLTATSRDGTVSIVYDYKNNGRGPTMAETLHLGKDGLPDSWTITGATTFGSKVNEHFKRAGNKANWTDSVGSGSTVSSEPSLYIGQSASPWALGVYARALLADADRQMPTIPGGKATLTAGESLSVNGKAGAVQVHSYALSGLDLNPSYLLLDDSNALFAFISPNMVVVRSGYEADETRLRGIAERLSTERFKDIQKQTAHNYRAPLRIRNVRIFDPAKLSLSEPVSVLVNGERISSVEPLDSPSTPGEVLIDGAGGTLVAGLNDMHAHISQNGALLNIAAGITSVRDMGNNNAVLSGLIDPAK